MFFDKLWVRIKGELLTLKEDFPGAQEIREKGEQLLEKLERRLEGLTKGKQQRGSADVEAGKYPEKDTQTPSSLQDIEQEWDELLKLREERKQDSKDHSEAGLPNPRTLG